jgi:hypothetical protein
MLRLALWPDLCWLRALTRVFEQRADEDDSVDSTSIHQLILLWKYPSTSEKIHLGVGEDPNIGKK